MLLPVVRRVAEVVRAGLAGRRPRMVRQRRRVLARVGAEERPAARRQRKGLPLHMELPPRRALRRRMGRHRIAPARRRVPLLVALGD
ncbi:MAG: hypothetical protein IBJ07_19655 [Rhizobiaceae bacterium]|nr:hypothetical protein [Rhizobiaceae bacterium]